MLHRLHPRFRLDPPRPEAAHETSDAVAAAAKQKEVTREIRKHLLRGQLLRMRPAARRGWHAKRRLSPLISSDAISTAIYDLANANGAVGGKLLGAGGGGFFVFFVAPVPALSAVAALEHEGPVSCARIAFDEDGLQTWKCARGAPARAAPMNAQTPATAHEFNQQAASIRIGVVRSATASRASSSPKSATTTTAISTAPSR